MYTYMYVNLQLNTCMSVSDLIERIFTGFHKYMIVPLHPCTSACKSLYLMWEHPFGKSLSTLPPFLCGTQHFKKTVEAMGYGKGVNTKPILFNPFQVSNHIKLSHFWV